MIFRSGINKRDLESLAAADALSALSGDRHRAFWQASAIDKVTDDGYSGSFFKDQNFLKNDFNIDVLLPTVSEEENENCAPYSFFNGVSSDPPMIMFANNGVAPSGNGPKDTFSNIKATKEFVVNISTYNTKVSSTCTLFYVIACHFVVVNFV